MLQHFSQINIYAPLFDQNLGSTLIYFFYLHTTIRQKYMVLFHLFFMFMATLSSLESFSYISYAISTLYEVLAFIDVVRYIRSSIHVPLFYVVRYIHGYMNSHGLKRGRVLCKLSYLFISHFSLKL